MADDMLTSEEALARLAETPRRIAALTADLTPAQTRTAPSAGEWSAVELLAHVRSCSDVWGGYIARILTEDHPTIRVVNPTRYILQTDYPTLEWRSSFQAYLAQREELLSVLRPLSEAQWARRATITGAGAPLEHTVQSYVSRLARHERAHVRQFQQIVAAVASA